MKLVLVRLEVSKLGKSLATRVQSAHKRSVVLMDQLVCPVIASLGKLLATVVMFAHKRLFASVRSLVGPQVSSLSEPLSTARHVTLVRFISRMRAFVDVEMCLLVEALVTARKVALVFEVRPSLLFPDSSIHKPHRRQQSGNLVHIVVQLLALGHFLLVQLLRLDNEHQRVHHGVANGQ